MKTIMNIIFALLIINLPILAQSVDEIVKEALQNNPQLKAMQNKVETAQYKSDAAGWLPPPTLGIEFSQVPVKSADLWNDPVSQNISISQMFMPGKLSAMREAEQKNVAVARNDVETYRLNLIMQVKSQYYKVWMNEHHIELREEIDSLLTSVLESQKQLYELNKANYSNLLQLEAEIASNKTEEEVMRKDLKSAVIQLNALIGRGLNDEEITVQHNWNIDTAAFNAGELEESLNSANPELQKMKSMAEMNSAEITANRKELIPDIMVQGMIMRMPRGMLLTAKDAAGMLPMEAGTDYMYSIMASITLPFAPWSRGKIDAREEELLSTISGIEAERTDMQRRMLAEMKSTVEQIEGKRMQVKLLRLQVIPLYKKTLEAQLTEFQNNRLPISSLIETSRMILMKEEEEAERMMEHQMLMAQLNMLTGKEF